jgi:hypothetical protein
MLSDKEIKDKYDCLQDWIKEGREFPNNYRNIEQISIQSIALIDGLILDRRNMIRDVKTLIQEVKRLKAKGETK